jgi:hypothetical protein
MEEAPTDIDEEMSYFLEFEWGTAIGSLASNPVWGASLEDLNQYDGFVASS